MHAGLKKFLKKHAVGEELAVLDKKLGGIVQEKMGINCVYRCVMRGQRTRVGAPSVAWVIWAVAPQALALTPLPLLLSPLCSNAVMELTRGVRNQLQGLIRCASAHGIRIRAGPEVSGLLQE